MADIDPINAANALTGILAAIGGFPSPSTTGPTADSTTVTTDTASMSSPTDTAGDQFVFPGAQQYGVNSPFGGARGHPGIDLAFPDHTPVLAAMAGTIIAAVDSNDPGTYNVVRIQHPNGVVTEYGHLSGVNVHVGDTVKAGQQIGVSGGAAGERGTYNSTGPHLHFQVDVNGTPVDPAPFLAGAHAIVGTTGGTVTTTTTSSTPEQKLAYAAGNVATAMTSGEGPPQARGDLESQTTTSTVRTPGGGEPQAGGTPGTSGNFPEDILKGIGAPITAENIRFIEAWMRAEGGASHNNPLNTTQGAPGASDFNSVGVKTYPDYQTGVNATVQTLLNGMYGNIIQALRRGVSAQEAANALANSPWGTGSLVQQILGGG